MTKIFTGVTAILLIVIGLMSYQMTRYEEKISDRDKTIGDLSQSLEQQYAINNAQSEMILGYQEELEARDKIDMENELEKQKIQKENKSLALKLKRLKNEDPEASKYLDTVIPNSVFVSMFDQPPVELPDTNTGDNQTSTGQVHDGNPSSLYPGEYEPGHYPAEERFQSIFGQLQCGQKIPTGLA